MTSHINVGTGVDISIRELAEMVRDVVYPEAELTFDTSKPDGTPRKVLDVAKLNELGWSATTGLRAGIESTYDWFLGLDGSSGPVPRSQHGDRVTTVPRPGARRALITGITGQDGSYLADLLLGKGYEVHGLVRRSSSINTPRIDHLYQDPDEPDRRLFLHYGDLADAVGLVNLIREIEPDEVYNLAAQSHVAVSFEVPEYTGDVTGMGAVRLLEAIRAADIADARFYQASSSEMFGSTPPPQSELTPFHPRSPYACAKVVRAPRHGQLPRGLWALRRATASCSTTRARAGARRS